MRPKPISPLSR